jgi:hypothetical protein
MQLGLMSHRALGVRALPVVWGTLGVLTALACGAQLMGRFDALENAQLFVTELRSLSRAAEAEDPALLRRRAARIERIASTSGFGVQARSLSAALYANGGADDGTVEQLLDEGLRQSGRISKSLRAELIAALLGLAVWFLIAAGLIRGGRRKLVRAVTSYQRALAVTYQETVVLQKKLDGLTREERRL